MPLAPNGHGLTENPSLRETIAAEARARIARQPTPDDHMGLSVPPREQPLPLAQPQPPRRGLIDAFVKTCQRWGLPATDQIVLLGYSGNQFLGSEILTGRFLDAPQDAKDRASYILAIAIGLGALFNESLEAELGWLNTPHKDLGAHTPLQFMKIGRMRNVMAVAALVDKERNLP